MHCKLPWCSKHPSMVSKWCYIESILISEKLSSSTFSISGESPKCPKMLFSRVRARKFYFSRHFSIFLDAFFFKIKDDVTLHISYCMEFSILPETTSSDILGIPQKRKSWIILFFRNQNRFHIPSFWYHTWVFWSSGLVTVQ